MKPMAHSGAKQETAVLRNKEWMRWSGPGQRSACVRCDGHSEPRPTPTPSLGSVSSRPPELTHL